MSASPAVRGKSPWSEYKNSEGRVYWSHATTKQSVWEKPDELKTPFESALSKTEWRQYTSKDRPYYVNSRTKETKWELPQELQDLKKRIEADEAYKAERERRKAAGLPSPTPPRSRSPSFELDGRDGALARYASPSQRRSSTPMFPARSLEVVTFPPGGFLTHEKAEEGFFYLLKREGVDETWTWDQTMRKIIMDPLYKAFDSLAQKKAAFEKFQHSIISDRQAEKDARIARLRPALNKLFSHHIVIKSYSTLKTANAVFSHDRHWREAKEDEKRMLLDDFTTDLRHREEGAERDLRQRNIQSLGRLIRTLDISPATPWRGAHNIILSAPEFRNDPDLQQIETIDILDVFDDYSRQVEQEFSEESRRLRSEHTRKGRKAREGFKALLSELESKGDLTKSSRWKDTYPKIQNDERYVTLLGIQGSSPMDLWMDAVDDLGEEAERAAEKIIRAFKEAGKEVGLETSLEDYEGWVKEVHLDTQVDSKTQKEVYDMLHGRFVQTAADEARRAERKRRHRMDDLRYALKKVQRHIDPDMTYEEAAPHMKDLSEFADVIEEEDRRTAFDKFIRRQKEKLREIESSEVGSTRSQGRRESNRMDVDEPDKSHRDKRSSRKDKDDERHRERDRGRSRDGRSKSREKEKNKKYRDKDRDRKEREDDDDDRDKRRERRSRREERDGDRKERRYRDTSESDDREPKRPRRSEGSKRKERFEEGEVEEGEI